MNNKGFTLVEVIAIIVVLVGIFLVSFPAINNAIAPTNKPKTILSDMTLFKL